jgi:hypothetical protein
MNEIKPIPLPIVENNGMICANNSLFDPCEFWAFFNVYLIIFCILAAIGIVYFVISYFCYQYIHSRIGKLIFASLNLFGLILSILKSIDFGKYFNTPQIEMATIMGIILLLFYSSPHFIQIYKCFRFNRKLPRQ